jgi:hypothetical protein
MRGEEAVIQKQVDRGPGDDGRELLHELDRLEEQMRSAITPHRLEFDEDASVGPEADAVLGERGAEEVAALCGPGSYADQAPTWAGGTLRMPRLRPPRRV